MESVLMMIVVGQKMVFQPMDSFDDESKSIKSSKKSKEKSTKTKLIF